MTRARARLVASMHAALVGTTFCAVAIADGTNPHEQKAAAQVLFEQGRALVEQGRFVDACPKLAESARLDPGIGTLLWLGDCYENAGLTASAWASFKEAAAAAAARHDDRERVAHDRAAQLEPKLTRLNILVPAGAAAQGMQVEKDGLLVGSAEWGIALPVDPGVHTIAATAPGRRPYSATIQVPVSEEVLPLTIPPLVSETTQANRPGETASGRATPSSERPKDPPQGNAERVAGAALAGAGVAALVVGAVFSFDAKARYDDSNRGGHCLFDNECDAIGKADRSQAASMALVATVAMSAGGAALAAGAIVFFIAPKAPPVAVAWKPVPHGTVLRVTFPW